MRAVRKLFSLILSTQISSTASTVCSPFGCTLVSAPLCIGFRVTAIPHELFSRLSYATCGPTFSTTNTCLSYPLKVSRISRDSTSMPPVGFTSALMYSRSSSHPHGSPRIFFFFLITHAISCYSEERMDSIASRELGNYGIIRLTRSPV